MDFWARRKAAVEAEAQAELQLRETEARAAQEAAQAEKTDAELLEELGLPEPESLGPEDDFKAFMVEGVPQRLKSRALRCLWRSNPILANVDGLVDYGEDFTDASCVIENMQTAYQVGKGMLSHIEEMARKAEAAGEQDPAMDLASDEEVPGQARDAEGAALTAQEVASTAPEQGPEDPVREEIATLDTALDDTDEMAPPPRRRMAFTFDDTTAGARQA